MPLISGWMGIMTGWQNCWMEPAAWQVILTKKHAAKLWKYSNLQID
jgi:hypothetical protein